MELDVESVQEAGSKVSGKLASTQAFIDLVSASRFRKNLKKLYILHPTFFTRTLVQLISTGAYFVSPKFSKKIVQVKTMSELATMVDVRQIDFPPEVLACNAKLEDSVTLSGADKLPAQEKTLVTEAKMFGVPLSSLMGERGEKGGVPRVLRDCAEFLRADGRLKTEGLFRRSPASSLLKAVQESYDRGAPVNLSTHYQDPHIAAVLIKLFFRMLPKPIFSATLYPIIKACPRPDGKGDAETLDYIREVILGAIDPPCQLIVLSQALELLCHVSQHSDENKMNATNLATVFTPNLVRSGNALRDMSICLVQGAPSMTQAPATSSPVSAKANAPSMTQAPATSSPVSAKANEVTLGTIIKVCIERYYEIFEEIDFEPPTMTFEDDGLMAMAFSGGTPGGSGTLRRHRKVDSGNSLARFGAPSAEASPSIRSAKSSEFRGPHGVHAMSRNASGSLRLTKGRLGSSSFKGIPSALITSANPGSEAQGGRISAVLSDASSPPLTGTSSGVTVSGMSAQGQFSSSSPAASLPPPSPLSTVSSTGGTDEPSPFARIKGTSAGRRELSMVEDLE
jgi:Rho GTPase-activating protein 1